MKTAYPLVLLLILLISCENPITYDWNASVNTDAAQYNYPGIVSVNIVVGGKRPVYVKTREGSVVFSLERQYGAVWEPVFTTGNLSGTEGNAGGYMRMAPGDEHSFTFNLSVLQSVQNISAFYRVRLEIMTGEDKAGLLPEHMLTTNSFSVIVTQNPKIVR